MLLSNYGRDQGDSSFDESSQAQPGLQHSHHQHQHHQPLPPPLTSTDLSSSSSSFVKPAVVPQTLSSPSSSAEQMLACQRPSAAQQQEQQRRLKPQSDQVLKCPRCDSMNTKFCYYNNYSLTQPRHFCKSCKRYWTKGGALRNVPVGGGCRKNKRVKQRQQDHGHQQATSTTTEDTNGAGVTASAATSGLDGASSSTILQQDYPATSSSSGLYDVQKTSSGAGGGLPFERVADHVPRMFSTGPNPPISIHWAGQMALSSQQHQAYDAAASILGLNMPGSIKQEAGVHSAPELTSMFDSSLAGVAAATAAAAHVHGVSAPLTEGLSSFHHVPMDHYGLAGEVLWRFPQPKLVSLLEEGSEPEPAGASRHGLLDLEAAAAAAASSPAAAAVDKLKPSKARMKEVSSSEYEQQQGDSSSQEWQPPGGDGFFEGNTSAYWANAGGWSSELQYGGGAPTPGAQLM